jgi:hypothetical protein
MKKYLFSSILALVSLSACYSEKPVQLSSRHCIANTQCNSDESCFLYYAPQYPNQRDGYCSND